MKYPRLEFYSNIILKYYIGSKISKSGVKHFGL